MTNTKSRLKRLEEQRAMKTTILYIVLTVATLFLLLRFGIPALSSFTSFITGNVREDSIDFGTNSPPPPPPNVTTPPEDTSEEKITIKGGTRPGYTVSMFFNDEKTEVLANSEGEFTGVFELSEGQNSFYAFVTDNKGQNSTETRTYTINLDKKPPELKVITPENSKQFFGTREKQIKIEGETEPNVHVIINDRVAIVGSDGKFNYNTSLNDGENVFKIKSTDPAGNVTELELKLTFTP